MEGTNSFLEELLPFGKGLKNREAKSYFQQNSLDHGQVNSNFLVWAIDAGLYLYDTLWLCIDSCGISINPLRNWTFSLSLIDFRLIMGSQVDNSSNNYNSIMWKSPCTCIRQADLCILKYSQYYTRFTYLWHQLALIFNRKKGIELNLVN